MSTLSEKIKVMKEMVYVNSENIQATLKDIYAMLDENEVALKQCYELDKEDTNKKENLIIKRMLDSVQSAIDYQFEDTQIHEMIDERKILEFKQKIGVIGVIYDGDVYTTIDLICKAIKTGNAIILNVGKDNFIGTNNLLVKAVQEILVKNNKPEGLVEINFSETDELAEEELDKLIVIGDIEKQKKLYSLNMNTLKSGYGYNEIYIDDLENESFIKEMVVKVDGNIKFFIKSDLKTTIEGVKVRDCNEAIMRINNEGAGYAASIFSNDAETQRNFMKRLKNKYVFINASPTIARDLDIEMEDFYYKKIGMV